MLKWFSPSNKQTKSKKDSSYLELKEKSESLFYEDFSFVQKPLHCLTEISSLFTTIDVYIERIKECNSYLIDGRVFPMFNFQVNEMHVKIKDFFTDSKGFYINEKAVLKIFLDEVIKLITSYENCHKDISNLTPRDMVIMMMINNIRSIVSQLDAIRNNNY